MALQWYRRDPETGRLEWRKGETRPGPDWEAADVPPFDSDRLDPERMWRVQEDSPVYLQEEDYPEFRQDRAVRTDLPEPPATGLFQMPPEGKLPAYEFRKAHPTEYRPPAPALQLMQGEQEVQESPPREYLAQLRELIRLHYPETAAALDEVAPLPSPVSLVPRPADRGHSPRVRAWWQQVHRLSSVRRGRPTLPWRSGPRVAGHRKQGWT